MGQKGWVLMIGHFFTGLFRALAWMLNSLASKPSVKMAVEASWIETEIRRFFRTGDTGCVPQSGMKVAVRVTNDNDLPTVHVVLNHAVSVQYRERIACIAQLPNPKAAVMLQAREPKTWHFDPEWNEVPYQL